MMVAVADPRWVFREVLTRAADLIAIGELEVEAAVIAATRAVVGDLRWETGYRRRNPQGEIERVPGEPVDPAIVLMNWTRFHLSVDDLAAWAREHTREHIVEAMRGCAVFRGARRVRS